MRVQFRYQRPDYPHCECLKGLPKAINAAVLTHINSVIRISNTSPKSMNAN